MNLLTSILFVLVVLHLANTLVATQHNLYTAQARRGFIESILPAARRHNAAALAENSPCSTISCNVVDIG